MTIYFILLILIIFCILLETNVDYIKISVYRISVNKICFYLIFTSILLIGVLRYEFLGVDVANYNEYFHSYQKSSWVEIIKDIQADNGYILLNRISGLISTQFWVFKSLLYSLTFSVFSYVIYKNSKYYSISFLIYIALGYLGVNFCILRQAIAISICFLAFKYAKEKNLLKFVLIVLIAATFHKTAIIYLFLYPIVNGKFEKLAFLKKVSFIFVAIFVSIFILPVLFKFYRNDYSELAIAGEGGSMLIFYSILIITFGYIKAKFKIFNIEAEFNGATSVIYAQIIAFSFSLFSRIGDYFSILFCLLIPNLIYNSKYKKTMIFVIVLLFSLLYIYTIYSDGTNIVPYKFNF